jgi:tRNA (guanine37-N1)-methyltransferase
MWCGIVTLFPEMFCALTDYGITGRAITQGLVQTQYWNPRDFAIDKHQTVDDRPYGGGPGMVMQVYPLRHAIQAARNAAGGPAKVVYFSPQGRTLEHAKVREVAATEERLIFVAGRYEGVDERLLDLEVDEEWSIGDYVLSGGELAIMVALDAIIRWLPGALGHEESAAFDSFAEGLLDCPHYTRPEIVDGLRVPEVLLQGDHAAIAQWRLKQRLGRTWLRRRELLEKQDLDPKYQALLQAFIREHERGET